MVTMSTKKVLLTYNREKVVHGIASSALIRTSSKLQIPRTGIKSWSRSNLGRQNIHYKLLALE